MNDLLSGLMHAVPFVAMSTKQTTDMKLQLKDLVGAAVVGVVSAAMSIFVLTAKLDERTLSLNASQVEIKAILEKARAAAEELSQRVARIEGSMDKKK